MAVSFPMISSEYVFSNAVSMPSSVEEVMSTADRSRL
jgi:hypothetical protein